MPHHNLSVWPHKGAAPGVHSFALLSGLDAVVRAMLSSVLPIEMYNAFKDADQVSFVYFVVGFLSLGFGLMVPKLTSVLPRRWTYTLGIAIYLAGHLASLFGPQFIAFTVACQMIATVTCFVCLNAYVLDYIERHDLGRNESVRMVYSGLAWTIGPLLGVTLLQVWRPLPYLIAAAFAIILLATFWVMRLGNGKAIVRAKGPAPSPLAYLGRFLKQPRLVTGWIYAVIRASGWMIFTVYVPIYAVSQGMDARIGGLSLSMSSAMLFATPLMLRWMQRYSVRTAVRTGFLGAAICFFFGTVVALYGLPWAAVAVVGVGTFFLLLLDVSGSLPFLMAVKPSERTEMAAVYSSFRDVAGIFTPGLAWIVLLGAPLPWLFAAMGGALLGCWGLAGSLHPRLGEKKKG